MRATPTWTDLTDYVYPRLAGSNRARAVRAKRHWRKLAAADRRSVEQLASNEEQLRAYVQAVDKVLEREQSRKQSVEGRLTSIVGLTSLAATVVIGSLLALAAGTLPIEPGWAIWVLALGSLYLVLQLFVALNAAVKGLSRADYVEDTAAGLFGSHRSAASVRLREQIERKLSQLSTYRQNGDARVSQMAVAHRAFKNFLGALLLLAIAATLIAVMRSPAPQQVDRHTTTTTAAAATTVTTDAPAQGSRGTDALASNLALPLLLVAFGLAALTAGAVFILAPRPIRNLRLGAALVIGGSLLSVLGGSKLELHFGKIDKLIGELQIRLFERAPVPPPRVSLVRVATIGPFPDGGHVLGRDAVLSCLLGKMTPRFTSAIGGWLIVGRVDKRKLKPELAALYGSNQTLAMSRANWVRDQVLVRVPGFDATSSVVSVGGAGQVGRAVEAIELQSDRAVDLYALVAQTVGSDEKSVMAPLDSPLACPR